MVARVHKVESGSPEVVKMISGLPQFIDQRKKGVVSTKGMPKGDIPKAV